MNTEPDFKTLECTSCGNPFEFALGENVAVILSATCFDCGRGTADVIGMDVNAKYIWEGT